MEKEIKLYECPGYKKVKTKTIIEFNGDSTRSAIELRKAMSTVLFKELGYKRKHFKFRVITEDGRVVK